ncbi:MAG: ABC transporter permease [Acidobacteriota bacterium]|nr:ABC transporter permease [Acidobacteriota bacterium]
MRNILLIAKRDYLASVRTKAFLIGLLVAPLLFGGSFFATVLLKGHPDKQVRRIAVVDKTNVAAPAIIKQIEQQNLRDGFDKNTGVQVMPKYEFETVTPELKNPDAQRLVLSNRVRRNELFAFLEIDATSVQWYSNEGGFGETDRWLAGPVDDGLRRLRLTQLGLDEKQLDQALRPVPMESMNLVTRDEKTGQIMPARKRGIAEGFAAPFVLAILFFMIVLLTSAPMLAAVAEDKTQRVFEMLLASVSPFDLISGKVLAAVGIALTSSIFYVVGAVVLLEALALIGLAPLKTMPWFFLYLVAEVAMLASVATALGAACSSTRDAENLKLILIAPVMIPFLFLTPILQEPNGTFATAMSFFPIFTPILMLVRQASPGGVPAWQPWFGLAGVVIATLAISWIASRIFRIAILFQGKTPNLAELLRWGVTG